MWALLPESISYMLVWRKVLDIYLKTNKNLRIYWFIHLKQNEQFKQNVEYQIKT